MSLRNNSATLRKQPSSTLRRVRIAAAALCFALALAAFIDFRDLVPVSLKHAIASVQFVPSALTFAAAFHITAFACIIILAITLLIGRVYCSVLCPLGILQDVISRLSAKIRRVAPYKLPYKKPRDLLRYSILAVTLLAIVAGWAGVALAWLDPYSNFGRIASSVFRPVAVVINNLAATIATALDHPAAVPKVNIVFASAGALLPPLLILTALTIMAAFRGRLWCNTLCPVGTLLGAVSGRALWRLGIDKAACRKCGDCLRACKAQCIDLRAGEIDFSRCVACYDCISVCDERGIGYRWRGLSAPRTAERGISNPKSRISKISSACAKCSCTTSNPSVPGAETPSPEYETTDPGSEIPNPETPKSAPPPSEPQKSEILKSGSPSLPGEGPPPRDGTRRAFITVAAAGTLAAGGAVLLAARNRLGQNKAPANGKHDHPRGDGPGGGRHDLDEINNPGVVAPPGAHSTARILSQCTACQLCISACPSHVIVPAFLEYGSFSGLMKPRLDFDKNFCNINCTACADVCPDGALLPLTHEAKQTMRIGLAHTVHPRCIIITDGTACGACAEHCPTAALQMKKVPNHPEPLPVVDPRYCIGCGACQYACPPIPKAIIISGLAAHEKAEVLVQEKVTAPAAAGGFAF